MKTKIRFKQTEIGKIPEEWNVVTIDEIKSEKKHALAMGPFGSNITKNNFVDSGVPVIRGNNLTNYRFLDGDFVFVTEEKAEELKSSMAYAHDIVITHRGSLGQVGIIPLKSRYEKYIVSQSGMKLTCNTSRANPEFVFYFLKSPQGQHLLLRNTSQTGVPAIAQPLASLKNVPIPLPTLEEQNLISGILSNLDSKIELNHQMNAVLERIAQALFKRWFVDFEFPNEKGEPYRSSGGRMVDSELGKIPKGWRVGELGELIELGYGKGLPEGKRQPGEYPVVGSNGILGWHNEYYVKGPGIVIGRKGTIGAVIWIDYNYFPIDTTFYVIPKVESHGLYYFYFLLQRQDFPKIGSDSAVPGLNRNFAYGNMIIIPPAPLIIKFNNLCKIYFDKIKTNKEEVSTLANIRDSLLPKLMSGKIRVPVEVSQ